MNITPETVAVVTGAASGIGRSLCLALAKAGAKVAIQDLNKEGLVETQKLIEAAGGMAKPYIVDVGNRDQIYHVKEKIMADFGHVDLVVNNAGVALYRISLKKVTQEQFDWLMNINFWGVVHGTQAYLPELLSRPEAYVINISSVFGLVGVMHNGPYCCAKFAVRGYSESLRAETMDTALRVMVVHPGGIKTNIARNARGNDTDPIREKDLANFERAFRTTPEEAAATIMGGIARNKSRLLIGKDARQIDFWSRLMPERFVKMLRDRMIKEGLRS